MPIDNFFLESLSRNLLWCFDLLQKILFQVFESSSLSFYSSWSSTYRVPGTLDAFLSSKSLGIVLKEVKRIQICLLQIPPKVCQSAAILIHHTLHGCYGCATCSWWLKLCYRNCVLCEASGLRGQESTDAPKPSIVPSLWPWEQRDCECAADVKTIESSWAFTPLPEAILLQDEPFSKMSPNTISMPSPHWYYST